MHWHPNADEWQYFISGRARLTVFGAHGRSRTEEFGRGTLGLSNKGSDITWSKSERADEILRLVNSPPSKRFPFPSGWREIRLR